MIVIVIKLSRSLSFFVVVDVEHRCTQQSSIAKDRGFIERQALDLNFSSTSYLRTQDKYKSGRLITFSNISKC